MKILLLGFVPGVIFVLTNVSENHVTTAQYFANASKFFVPIEFGNVNRAAWNMTKCYAKLLTCWETMRPELLCWEERYYTGICAFWKRYCHDLYGADFTSARGTLFDAYCDQDRADWTKFQIWHQGELPT